MKHVLETPLAITTAGAPPWPSVIEQLDALGITVVHVYGLTEVYGPYRTCEYQREWDDLPAADRAATGKIMKVVLRDLPEEVTLPAVS